MQTSIYSIKLSRDEAQSVFDDLRGQFRIIAPVTKKNQGRFSDTELVTYDEVQSLDQIEFNKQSFFSAKSVVFPIRETLFSLKGRSMQEQTCEMKPTIVFLRSCDIHAMQVIDLHFLKDNNKEDSYYKRRREKVKFFLIECPQSFENCYCVSMGTNRTDDYSSFMRRTDNGYEVQLKDEQLKKLFPGRHDLVEGPLFAKHNTRSVTIPEEVDPSIFTDEMWQEYSTRCIACGRCNTSCPTCTCFTIQDTSDDDRGSTERRRIWSSCHVKKFALLAGGHDFRTEYSDRMRYRTLHKIRDFNKRNNRQMCIGCGRCDDVCPEYISMFRCIDKVNQTIEKRGVNG